MNFRLSETRVRSLTINELDVSKDIFELKYSNGYSKDQDDVFVVQFDVAVKSEQGFELEIQYVAEFESDESISDDFKKSQFPIVNAPAIAYPYLRAFISLLTLNAGYETLILPTVNFQAMANKRKEKEA
ncbi:protein-export chaperone SecB [Vibrio fluvialis]|uniref:protein-export chaperone SecB n=1 Tax=Vibrio fluvialis TaxID=676 RepID=UPI002572C063|nr:protein-export chaperone SecB [Vibrio fluvialis]